MGRLVYRAARMVRMADAEVRWKLSASASNLASSACCLLGCRI